MSILTILCEGGERLSRADAVAAFVWGQRIFPVGMMGKALTHIRHIE